MKYTEAKSDLIQAWGNLGYSWGLNKVMAQIHALLMVSAKPLSADEIMDELKISRGNANMNIRALLEWNIIYRISVPGERKEYSKLKKIPGCLRDKWPKSGESESWSLFSKR